MFSSFSCYERPGNEVLNDVGNIHSSFHMALPENRESSFKRWPFKAGPATAKEMAKAGLYLEHVKGDQNNNDMEAEYICCYYCYWRTEGWEETDAPFEVHKERSPDCLYIRYINDRPSGKIRMSEIFRLERLKMDFEMECLLRNRKLHKPNFIKIEN